MAARGPLGQLALFAENGVGHPTHEEPAVIGTLHTESTHDARAPTPPASGEVVSHHQVDVGSRHR